MLSKPVQFIESFQPFIANLTIDLIYPIVTFRGNNRDKMTFIKFYFLASVDYVFLLCILMMIESSRGAAPCDITPH